MNEAFGVDSKGYYSKKKELEQSGSLEYKSPQEHRGKINKGEQVRMLEEHPDWYGGFAEALNVFPQGIDKMIKKLGVTRKKRFTYWEKSEKKRE